MMQSSRMTSKTIPISKLVDDLLAAKKTLAGVPEWHSSNCDDKKMLLWPLAVDGIMCEADLKAISYPYEGNGKKKWKIMIIFDKCIWRLDHTDDSLHVNSLDKPSDLPEAQFKQPHYHAWQDNKRFVKHSSLPDRLHNARILPANVQTFPNAMRWFCAKTNIIIPQDFNLDLPPKETLL